MLSSAIKIAQSAQQRSKKCLKHPLSAVDKCRDIHRYTMCVNEIFFRRRFFVPKLLRRHTALTQGLYARQVFVYKDKSALIHSKPPALTTITMFVYGLVE